MCMITCKFNDILQRHTFFPELASRDSVQTCEHRPDLVFSLSPSSAAPIPSPEGKVFACCESGVFPPGEGVAAVIAIFLRNGDPSRVVFSLFSRIWQNGQRSSAPSVHADTA